MSVTSGFFNSVNHDRRYNAAQMSAIFDGIINDGVFANIGVAFAVSAHTGVTISIGKGRAWFNSAWVYNDGPLLKTLEGSEVVLDRIDAVVIEVDHNENVRLGDIKIVKGTPASTPQRPKMAAEQYKHQYPLAYIYRKAGSTTITQADITSVIGTSSCPYITGILQVQNIDNIVAQWGAQWNQWYSEMVAETNTDASALMAEMRSEFDIWFRDVATLLDGDDAMNLAAQVAELMGKFDDLARDACIYDTIEDSNLDVILGSDGTPIQGKTVFSGSGSGSIEGVTAKDIGAVAIDGSTPMTGNLNVNQNRIMNVAEPEEDSDAASAGYVKDFVQDSKPARNLLINSDFRNPVNQRGQTSYNSDGYCYDRWVIWHERGCNVSYDSAKKCVRISSTGHTTIYQRFPKGVLDQNKKYTQAYGLADGGIVISTRNDYSPENYDTAEGIMLSPGQTLEIVWVALYEGEYTIETLPKYQPNGYENELLVCRQYDPVTGEYIGLRKFGYAPNLLDNSNFELAQAGHMQYNGPTLYAADRWVAEQRPTDYAKYNDRYDFAKTDGDLVVLQTTDEHTATRLLGKTVTLAVKTGDGSVYCASGVVSMDTAVANVNTPNFGVCLFFFASSKSFQLARIVVPAGKMASIAWIALYEGVHTIDTLPEYQPKGRMVEALNCGVLTTRTNSVLSANGWSSSAPYTQTVNVVGITGNDSPHISPVYNGTLAEKLAQQAAWGMVSDAEASGGYITFYCFEEKPTTAVTIQIEVNR